MGGHSLPSRAGSADHRNHPVAHAHGFRRFYQVSFLGTAATAAISPATMFVFTGLCAGMGIVTSVQTFASQSLGKGERENASAYTWQSIYIAMLMVPLAFIMTRVSDSTWAWIGAGRSPEITGRILSCRFVVASLRRGLRRPRGLL
ncbi:MAG: hypothetical protein IPK83_18110 [Planctomycetes bacterium]|nr:hypothetical protein [Planctomycetota bacterium]